MRYMKWIGLAAAVLLIVACFSPWVIIESRDITISGMDTTGSKFGIFHFTPRLWAKRFNLLVVGINTAWFIRNFFLIAVCRGGECPERQSGLYMLLLATILMLVAALFPDMEIPETKKEK
jgi:hypothetical protein